MQNRYAGDVGDFAKYALLRRLVGTASEAPVRLGVVWCLCPDELDNGDGRHISYLGRSDFAALDSELHAALRQIVESGRRTISAIACSEVLPSATVFCDGLICLPKGAAIKGEQRLRHRSIWLEECFRHTKACELVFFDPDNGLEVRSVPKHHPAAGKYIYWDELAPFWSRGQALLIYHHVNRTKPAADQVRQLNTSLQNRFDGALVKPLVFRRGSCRVFWLVCPCNPMGHEVYRRSNSFDTGGWATHFRS